MAISEQELRSMIRDAIARHGVGGQVHQGATLVPDGASCRSHASHGMLAIVATGDGECVIEPSVRCDHCGYCTSLGH